MNEKVNILYNGPVMCPKCKRVYLKGETVTLDTQHFVKCVKCDEYLIKARL